MSAPLAKTRFQPTLYDHDYFAWTVEQGRLLRGLRPTGLDWENVAEEIESLGRSDKRSIENNLNVVVLHLLKWRYQAEKRKGDWKSSLIEHRKRLNRLVAESPSLRHYPAEVLAREYTVARLRASAETGLPESAFPEECPFTIEQVLAPDFWPDETP
jgi:hypothetical protein